MLEITNESIYKVRKSLAIKNILNETFFILDSDTGKQYNLTEMEYEIMDCISKGMNFGNIIDILGNEYNASYKQIQDDLKEYITSLIEEGLIFG